MTSQKDDLYKSYLEEMQALENFRVSYTSARVGAQVDREDPDVRRLIDAMAFFTARTRASVTKNVLATQRRLFEQYFSFLLTPLAPTALLQVEPTGRFAESVVLPRGSEVLVTPEGSPGALFHTQSDLRILPIKLEAIDTLLRSRSGTRVVLTCRARFPRNDEIGTLPLLVSHLDDYKASLGVIQQLREHLEGVSVVFGEDKIDDETAGEACKVTYGAAEDPDALPDLTHPVQRVREFLHFPQQELFFNVAVPKCPPGWKQFSLLLDLDAAWSRNLRLNLDMFQLFTVPITNLKRSTAAPISCTGQKERFPLRFPTPAQKFSLHSVIGAFEILEGGALSPLRPGVIAGGSGSYEIERSGQGDVLQVVFPEAFEKPRKLSVDAFWIQPWFSERVGGKMRIALHSRNIAGVQLEIRGEVRPHAENPLGGDFDRMLELLALRSKTTGFGPDDLALMIEALGIPTSSPFRAFLPAILADMRMKSVQLPKAAGGQRHVYELSLREVDAADLPVIEAALGQVAQLLKAWTNDAEVFLELRVEGRDEPIKF
jgi:type VI secretion system protein ImpG